MNSYASDNDLSGSELKVIQYTIVSADPDADVKDSDRILAGPEVLATSDNLTDADFTGWVIARYLQDTDPDHEPPPHDKKQYLRVCYQVVCRLDLPDVNYQKEQASQLSRIARALQGHDKGDSGRSQALVSGKGDSKKS